LQKARGDKMPWLHAFFGTEFEDEIAQKFIVNTIPRSILVDFVEKIIATRKTFRGNRYVSLLYNYMEKRRNERKN
jgi:hypothetical protein